MGLCHQEEVVHNTDSNSTRTTSIQLTWDVGLDGPVFQEIVMTELQEPENGGFNPSALLLSAWTLTHLSRLVHFLSVYESVFVFHYKSIKNIRPIVF